MKHFICLRLTNIYASCYHPGIWPLNSSICVAGVIVEEDVTDEVTDQVTVGEVTNDNDAVEGFVVEIAKDETGSIVKAEAPITTGTIMVQRQCQSETMS